MSKPELIKRSGRLIIASAFAFITLLIGWDPIAIPGSVVSAILLAAGMSRLRAAYGERAGSLGRSMLLLGMFGPILLCIVIASMALVYSSRNLTNAEIDAKGLWIVIFGGPAISLLGLTLFGLTALRSKPMPRLNWLPVLAGIWYPVTYVLFSIYDISHKGVFPDQYLPALVLMVVIQFLVLCILGFVLMGDSSKELATA